MNHYNSVNEKLCNPQLNKLKLGKKWCCADEALNLSSNMIGDSNDEKLFHINYY